MSKSRIFVTLLHILHLYDVTATINIVNLNIWHDLHSDSEQVLHCARFGICNIELVSGETQISILHPFSANSIAFAFRARPLFVPGECQISQNCIHRFIRNVLCLIFISVHIILIKYVVWNFVTLIHYNCSCAWGSLNS